jgi:four helix bundle protein
MYVRPHKRLDIWKESVKLSIDIYRITEHFPKSEAYGLTSQMRRAAVSVPANVAEGAARKSSKEFTAYLYISGGSLSELDTLIEIAAQLEYITASEREKLDKQVESIGCKLGGLITHLASRTTR